MCVCGDSVGNTFELFRFQTLVSCVCMGFIVHGCINRGALGESALQASVR